MKKLKPLVIVLAGIAVLVIGNIGRIGFFGKEPKTDDHNCRMWVMVTTDPMRTLDAMVRQQLDSLRDLGWGNPDGWGIAYYIRPDSITRLPVIRRGEPAAPMDPRYPQAVDELAKYGSDGAMAHVRKASAGLTTGIPGPHPFDRRSGVINLRILFAHNGSIPTAILLDLIRALNANYLTQNPPDYIPNFLDSDLYCLYILENIDTYIDSTYEACIRTAVTRIDSALGINYSSYLNFVMTDGTTIWALCFADESPGTYSLFYYPDTGFSQTWVAASVPLDKDSIYWKAVPNKTLVTLVPGQAPRFTAMSWPKTLVREKSGSDLAINFRSVNRRVAAITFSLSWSGVCKIDIYDEIGRRVKRLTEGQRAAGSYVIYWNGQDDRNAVLPSGKYFCLLSVDGMVATEKIILLQ
jgi:predicted glutamine amidotransferase